MTGNQGHVISSPIPSVPAVLYAMGNVSLVCDSMNQTATEASNDFWQEFKAERQCKKASGDQPVGLAKSQ